PRAPRAQQNARVRQLAILMAIGENDEGRARLVAFLQALGTLGWIEGRNLKIHIRWGGGEIERIRATIAEVVELQPDVILKGSSLGLKEVKDATRAIPVVFIAAIDPVAAGIVRSFSGPGGNLTGFT